MYLETVCADCDRRDWAPSSYLVNLYQTLLLQEAGFPFSADDFEFGYWLDLGTLKQRITAAQRIF